jgi:hypothetical protein
MNTPETQSGGSLKPVCSVTPEEAHAAFDAEYQKWWDDMARLCSCPDGPCAGVLAGGKCDSPNDEHEP